MCTPNFIITFLLVLTTVNYSNGAPIKRQTSTTTLITYEQFLNLPLQSTPDQITQNFNGNPGVVAYESDIPGLTSTTIIEYSSLNPDYFVILTLSNDQLTNKAQSGLDANQYPITANQYGDITLGMSKDTVTSLVGEGQVVGVTVGGYETIGYNAPGLNLPTVFITYLQGQVVLKVEGGLQD